MGVFNSIYVDCPSCNKPVEFQTKSGSCLLTSFHISNVPKEELIGIMGEEEICSNCGYVVKIKKEKIDGTRFVE